MCTCLLVSVGARIVIVFHVHRISIFVTYIYIMTLVELSVCILVL